MNYVSITLDNPYALSTKFYAEVDFPPCVTHKGRKYYLTGKYGNVITTGVPSAEYATLKHSRLWLDANEVIYTEDSPIVP